MGWLQDIGSGVCRAVYNGPECFNPSASQAIAIATITVIFALGAFTRIASR